MVWALMPARAAGGAGSEELPFNPARIHPQLLKQLISQESVEPFPVLVEVRRTPGLLAGLIGEADELARRAEVIARLQAEARDRAAQVVDLAAEHGVGVRVFWISPVVRMEATAALIRELSLLEGVVQIRPDSQMRIAEFRWGNAADIVPTDRAGLPWNLSLIGLDLVQPGLGLDGAGVVVANLDSGVDWTHPALQSRYRGFDPAGQHQHSGNWHVSTGEPYPIPVDYFGHGTHTMGTLVGKDPAGLQTGVAPGARWIAVKMINNQGYFLESWVHDAFEWLMAPEGDPALAPDIINCSWGTGLLSDMRYQPDVQALRAAGVFPVFSAGNGGPLPATLGSPADYPEAFAVGAVDDAGIVTSFSARGPGPLPWAEVKPEIAAPGADIVSTVPGGGYFAADGTSMSAPHAAGTAALLLQADPSLGPDELENLLLQTASPLLPPNPNNDAGMGLLNAYGAAVAVSPHGEISGTVMSEDGLPTAFPVITATHLSGSPIVVHSGTSGGSYWLPLAPGRYRLSASAFGHTAVQTDLIQVNAGDVFVFSPTLDRLPSGILKGRILDGQTGESASGTLSIPGTAFVHPPDDSGVFTLTLPSGTWPLEVRAQGFRIGRITVTVTSEMTTTAWIELSPAPSILLVDSGRWYYNSKLGYFRSALDALDYVYDLHEVRDPYGVLSGVPDAPVLEDLLPYDLMIWSAPFDSPGLIQAGEVVSGYLAENGRLLISGQDVAWWDAGANIFIYPNYFPAFTGAVFEREQYENAAFGIDETLFEGLDLFLNAPDSDQEQYLPDSVKIQDGLLASEVMVWGDGLPALALAGGCHPYRLAWTGFGLEGSGPAPARVEAFSRLLAWMDRPPDLFGLALGVAPEPVIGAAGTAITRPIQLHNTGTESDLFEISLESSGWPIQLQLSDGSVITQSGTLEIAGCTSVELSLSVAVPENLGFDVKNPIQLIAASTADPSVSARAEILAKTPAPVLLLDDSLWFWYGDRYAAALEAMGLSFDYVNTDEKPLPDGILEPYPLVIWATGQDWFYVLPESDQDQMAGYLEGGGSLLLSSQEWLNVVADRSMLRKYFGVISGRTEVTPTLAVPAAGSFWPSGEPVWALNYPFVNWSDGFEVLPAARPLLRDELQNILGAAFEEDNSGARSIFYSFPLETLPDEALQEVLASSMLWLGAFGGSSLTLDPYVLPGNSLPLTLTLSTPGETVLVQGSALLQLPAGAEPVAGSLTGGWNYLSSDHVLYWDGDLYPGFERPLGAEIQFAPDLVPGTILNFPLSLQAEDARRYVSHVRVQAGGPRVLVSTYVSPAAPASAQEVFTHTVVARNEGSLTAQGLLTDTLPAGSGLLTDTLRVTSGTVGAQAGRVTWEGDLAPGMAVTVTYQTEAPFPHPPGWYVNFVLVADGVGSRGAWAPVYLPGSLYFPLVIQR